MESSTSRLKPFQDVKWPSGRADAVQTAWEWHEFLRDKCPFRSAEEAKDGFEEVKLKFEHEAASGIVPPSLLHKVHAAVDEHDFPVEWFLKQLEYAHAYYGAIQFGDSLSLKAFIHGWVSPHGYLIAKAADSAHSWQRKYVDELSVAFFIVDGLMHLKSDLEKDRCFIPVTELEHAGVGLDQLKAGVLTNNIGKLLWKQVIRARDAFAQGQPLLKDLERRYRGPFKRNWLTGLELLHELEKRKYDAWSEPLELGKLQKFQIRVLSLIGKGARSARA